MTSSWVQEEMEYPLIRTISSPTLTTDREKTHQGREASGSWAGSWPDTPGLLSRSLSAHFTGGGTKMGARGTESR